MSERDSAPPARRSNPRGAATRPGSQPPSRPGPDPAERRAEALARISQAFAEVIRDERALVLLVARTVTELTGDTGSVRLFSEDGQRALPGVWGGAGDGPVSLRRGFTHPDAPLLFDALVGRRECLLVEAGDPTLPASAVEDMRQNDYRAILTAPLLARDRVIGALTVVRTASDERFSDDQTRFVRDVAQRAALALDNARLFARGTLLAGRLRVLSEAAGEFSAATGDLVELLDRVARRMAGVGGLACIRLLSAAGDRFEGASLAWHAERAVRAAADRLLAFPLPVGTGLMGRVALTGAVLRVDDVVPGQLLRGFPVEHHADIQLLALRSIVVLPLLAAGSVVGVVLCARREPQPYLDEEVHFLSDLAGHAALAVANNRLVTRVSEGERRVADSVEQLRHAQKMEAVGRLAGGIAHDFNNILSVVLGLADLVVQGLQPGHPMRDDVVEIYKAGARAAELTGQLLMFSRREAATPRVVDVGDVIVGLRRMLGRLVGEDVALTVSPPAGEAPVLVDPGQLEQVVVNLVVNARDALPAGGAVGVEAEEVEVDADAASALGVEAGRYARITVRDSGIGMDEATKSRIFEPFYTTKPPGTGTGLGLSTVFGIVGQAGGGIAVETAPGRGTSFAVYLPKVAAPREAPAPVPFAGHLRGTEVVLLVEDDPAVRMVAREILRRYGYAVVDAPDGTSALRVLETRGHEIQLLLCDVVLPGMSGAELGRRVAAAHPHLRVLWMSGHPQDGRGAALLQKPLTPEKLARKVREVLDAG